AAAAAWAGYRKSLSFDSEDTRAISQDVTIGLARRGIIDPNADLAPSPHGRPLKVSQALILPSLNNKNWPWVITPIDGLDGKERGSERWRYWLGRAQRALSGAAPSAVEASVCPTIAREIATPVDDPTPTVTLPAAPSEVAPTALSSAPSTVMVAATT